jgi:hypothetical protein
MNWKVGLLWLWVVFAIIDAGATMLAWWPKVMREFKRSDEIMLLNRDCKDVSTKQYVVIGKVLPDNLSKQPVLTPWPGSAAPTQTPSRCYAHTIGHPWQTIGDLILVGTWFPALVLALGSALYWAFAGFRKA